MQGTASTSSVACMVPARWPLRWKRAAQRQTGQCYMGNLFGLQAQYV